MRDRALERYRDAYEESWKPRFESNPEWRGLLIRLCFLELELDELDVEMDRLRESGEPFFNRLENGAIQAHPIFGMRKDHVTKILSITKALGIQYSSTGKGQKTRRSKQAQIADMPDDE